MEVLDSSNVVFKRIATMVLKSPSRMNRPGRHHKNTILIMVLGLALVWGSSFLLTAINNLRNTNNPNQDFEEYVMTHAPPLLSSDKPRHWPSEAVTINGKQALNLTNLKGPDFQIIRHQFQWINSPDDDYDKGTYLVQETGLDSSYIIKLIVDDSYKRTLFHGSSFDHDGNSYNVDSLVASPDLKRALLRTNTTHNWRHSTKGLFWVLDVSDNKIDPLYDTDTLLSFATWSPTSNDVAFVAGNNIYIKSMQSGDLTQITFDGDYETFNGRPDWVYEEEVLGTDTALWWSPGGDYVAFLKSDDTKVPQFPLTYFLKNGAGDYPAVEYIKYPKAGYANPIVDIVLYSLKDCTSDLLVLESSEIAKYDRLITEVFWAGNSVIVTTSNRASDILEKFLVDAKKSHVDRISSTHCQGSWFEITSSAIYVPQDEKYGRIREGYIDLVSKNGYDHLVYNDMGTGETKPLTQGLWDVTDILSFNYETNLLYFVGTQGSSIERHIFSLNVFEDENDGMPHVNKLTRGEGWYHGSISSKSKYMLLNYEGPETPYQELIDLETLELILVIESNDQLKENLDKYALPKVKYQIVELEDEETKKSFKAHAVETLPVNFDANRKYPVLFFTYGGPGSQLVNKRFAINFSGVVASQLDAVVVTVDGRGTGFNNLNEDLGADYKFIVRDKLGKYESLDQIAAAKQWANRPYIDRERMAIWGWSYGGFLSLKTMESDYAERLFSFGAAIAPVTKWKLYDSVYTERYMRTPQENPDGYEIASIHNVTNFEGVTKFFIGHGTGDDNVHVQNTLQLLGQFQHEQIENYEMMIFPDSDHLISYDNANTIVYDKILEFFRNAFAGEYD